MAQYDVHPNPSGPGYLLDCQSDILAGFSTRLVVPLLPPEFAPNPPGRRLNPHLRVGDEDLILMTHFAAAVPSSDLGKAVACLAEEHLVIMNAFDMLLTGY
jgi:toxin CcdB